MAKDILVNTQSGDLVVSDGALHADYWPVVWGKVFDSDESEYMNIVVPNEYVNDVRYKDNQFECAVHAEYRPVNDTFLVRLIVENAATGSYNVIHDFSPNAPREMGAVYYPKYTGRPQDLNACQLPAIDINGNFKVLFKRYSNSDFSRAIITSAMSVDFTIGDSDSQSAQLLARCAPGKYYRYPTTGLDLTKYINSVVEHTDMASELVRQFSSDSKQIIDAEFNSENGDLKIRFSGTNEADDKKLSPVDSLDVELFRIADDDFVRAAFKDAQSITDNNEEFIENLATTDSFMGIYDIGSAAEIDKINPSISSGDMKADGTIGKPSAFKVATMSIEAGKMYAVCYPPSIVQADKSSPASPVKAWKHPPLFILYKGETPVYVDEPFYTEKEAEAAEYKSRFGNRRCFIALADLTIKFYAGTISSYTNVSNYGIYPVSDKAGNYNSILGLSENKVTGKINGLVTGHSLIENVKIDIKTNRIIVIKQHT